MGTEDNAIPEEIKVALNGWFLAHKDHKTRVHEAWEKQKAVLAQIRASRSPDFTEEQWRAYDNAELAFAESLMELLAFEEHYKKAIADSGIIQREP